MLNKDKDRGVSCTSAWRQSGRNKFSAERNEEKAVAVWATLRWMDEGRCVVSPDGEVCPHPSGHETEDEPTAQDQRGSYWLALFFPSRVENARTEPTSVTRPHSQSLIGTNKLNVNSLCSTPRRARNQIINLCWSHWITAGLCVAGLSSNQLGFIHLPPYRSLPLLVVSPASSSPPVSLIVMLRSQKADC